MQFSIQKMRKCSCKEGWTINPLNNKCINVTNFGFPNTGNPTTEDAICTDDNSNTIFGLTIQPKHHGFLFLMLLLTVGAFWAARRFYKEGITLLVISMCLIPVGLIWLTKNYITKNP